MTTRSRVDRGTARLQPEIECRWVHKYRSVFSMFDPIHPRPPPRAEVVIDERSVTVRDADVLAREIEDVVLDDQVRRRGARMIWPSRFGFGNANVLFTMYSWSTLEP